MSFDQKMESSVIIVLHFQIVEKLGTELRAKVAGGFWGGHDGHIKWKTMMILMMVMGFFFFRKIFL